MANRWGSHGDLVGDLAHGDRPRAEHDRALAMGTLEAQIPVICGSLITLLTDFGTADGYVGEMKGVLLARAPDATLVDITHEIPAAGRRGGASDARASVASLSGRHRPSRRRRSRRRHRPGGARREERRPLARWSGQRRAFAGAPRSRARAPWRSRFRQARRRPFTVATCSRQRRLSLALGTSLALARGSGTTASDPPNAGATTNR